MRKNHHNILLAAAIALTLVAWMASASEARLIRSLPTSTTRVLKPGARTYSGEPDGGGNTRSQNGSGGFVPSLTGFGFILPVWVTRIVGAGW